MEQTNQPIWNAIKKHSERKRVWLHVPGHGGGLGLLPEELGQMSSAAKYDLTELPGLDDLFLPQGAIAEAQSLAASLWQADKCNFLVNGSSAGVQAMMLATCGPGDVVLAPRNAHGSFYHALTLTGAVPAFLPTAEYNGLPLNVTVEAVREGFLQNPHAKAVFLTSPSYYGVCANVAEIAKVARENNAVLLLDEAHGAHLGFHPDLPDNQGSRADLRVQSWHKTLGALTPGAVLHQHGDRIDQGRLWSALQMTQTSSPSYPILLSLDAARKRMALNGREVLAQMVAEVMLLRQKLAPLVPLLSAESLQEDGFALDITRITLLTGEVNCCGQHAAELLAERGIDVEFGQPTHLLAVVGPGSCLNKHPRLSQEITAQLRRCRSPVEGLALPWPKLAQRPREAFFAPSEYLAPEEAVGRIAAAMVVSYPPGIPLLAPGEIVTEEVVSYIRAANIAGISFRGIDKVGRIRLVK